MLQAMPVVCTNAGILGECVLPGVVRLGNRFEKFDTLLKDFL